MDSYSKCNFYYYLYKGHRSSNSLLTWVEPPEQVHRDYNRRNNTTIQNWNFWPFYHWKMVLCSWQLLFNIAKLCLADIRKIKHDHGPLYWVGPMLIADEYLYAIRLFMNRERNLTLFVIDQIADITPIKAKFGLLSIHTRYVI